MVLRRRTLLSGAAALAAPGLAAQSAPVFVVLPFFESSPADAIVRLVAGRAAPLLGRRVEILNRPGGNGHVAAATVAAQARDGSWLLCTGAAMLAPAPDRNPMQGLRPVMPVSVTPHIIVTGLGGTDSFVHIAYSARRFPGAIRWGTPGVGSEPYVTMLLTQEMVAGEFAAVHFRSRAACVRALRNGRVTISAEALPVLRDGIRAGDLQPLLIAGRERLAALPDVKTARETSFGGLENGLLLGLLAAEGTPDPALAPIAGAFAAALAEPALRDALAPFGTNALSGDGAALARMLRETFNRRDSVAPPPGAG